MKRTIAMSIMAFSILLACSERKSRVISFEYGRYKDTSLALLEGEVYKLNPELNTADSLVPLPNVTVQAEDSTQKVFKTTVTNKKGQFHLGVSPTHIYNLVIMKKGYQTARITNYIADTGQVSRVKIILEEPSLF